ncbi:hypothetical protein QJS10_CPA02g00766 [Acorus calamus]|uniref:Trichome birefringence-like N-terminal domain-containing protein n=1 Tax=Acorus calamus TaxID=4465 RepID=A0AAV9FAU1_ACOCL|nr:hypothetical protein QJS10_CPA02g00766 [Acorus calamus]
MTICSPKKSPMGVSYSLPRSISSILLSIGGLAVFLLFGSCVLVSHPIGSAVQAYFLSVDPFGKPALFRQSNARTDGHGEAVVIQTFAMSNGRNPLLSSVNASNDSPGLNSGANDGNFEDASAPITSINPNNTKAVDGGSCDLYHGKWFYDPAGPLYTNNSCPIITQMQNCQGNGRPDKEYEYYRWKPSQCDLPRFDGRKFLKLMRGKTLAFVGDSVARNQMESLLCILWQVESPKNRGNRRMQRWYFRSTDTYIARIWSSWLVHKTTDAFGFAPEGMDKLHLDLPDETFFDLLPQFDVVVLSSGHWFAKRSVYIHKGEIVGGQLWWPDKSRPMVVDNVKAFGISVETILTAISTHPNYKGLTLVRSYSPDHYEGGAWNTGGSCTGKTRPAEDSEVAENGFTKAMHGRQVAGYEAAVRANNGSSIVLMDVTGAFGYRHDGHPGPYRSLDPNKKTQRGPHGEPPPQDCLHWCMPGPVDTWNELLLETVRREFEGGGGGRTV